MSSAHIHAPPLHPVLLILTIQNYRGFPGFRATSGDFSAHSYEREVVLMEGMRMYVLGVEERRVEAGTAQAPALGSITLIHLVGVW